MPVSLPMPQALLLDFGGVIVDGPTSPTWAAEVAGVVTKLLIESRVVPLLSVHVVVEALIKADGAADTCWIEAAPVEQWSEKFWRDVVGATWPAEARRTVGAHATNLSRCVAELKFARTWHLRPGITDLLATAEALGLVMAVVSNAISAPVHRDLLASSGLARHFAVQLYSDEQGVRKPNPELVWRAVAALGMSPADCWFVGDTRSRDVLAARRAGCGAAVLMRSVRVDHLPCPEAVNPDVVVADPGQLRALLSGIFKDPNKVV